MKYQKWSHSTYDLRYHLVWITKYRKKVLNEKIRARLEEIIRKTCEKMRVTIIEIWFEEDHVHMYIRIPPTKMISQVVQQIKWLSSYRIKMKYREYFREHYWWTDSIWAEWYFIASVWEINWEIIRNYVKMQWKEENEEIEVEL